MKGKHLAIQITKNSARFVSIKNDLVVNNSSVDIQGFDEAKTKQEMESHFNGTSFLNEEFDEISLAWSTKRSTLIPNSIFAESTPTSIFELCYGKHTSGDDIDYNRISELSIVNVFEVPVWIKRFFVIKFPRIVIQHEGTHVLRMVMSQATFKTKATVVLHKDYFQLTIVKHNNLEFYSYFDCQSHEDVIYHLLFTLQQKEMTNETGSIEFALGADADKEMLKDIEKSIQKIKDIKKLDIKLPEDFIPKSQLLCV